LEQFMPEWSSLSSITESGRMFSRIIIKIILLMFMSISCAHATSIDYATTQLGASRWRYDYTIHNDSLGNALQEFTIYFDENLFANLVDESTQNAWDLLLIQPDTHIPDAGFLDGLTLADGLAAGASLDGLSVSFDYFGPGTPGRQAFSVVDPSTFATLDSGLTGSTAVPLPGTLGLFALGLAAGAVQRRRQRGVQ
jgi:hypothetical protein